MSSQPLLKVSTARSEKKKRALEARAKLKGNTNDAHSVKKEISDLRRSIKQSDNKMFLHMMAPDKYEPPHIPDGNDLMVNNYIYRGNLFRQGSIATRNVLPGLSSDAVRAFTPLPNFANWSLNLGEEGVVAASQPTWQVNPYATEMETRYTHYRLLGFKVTFKVMTQIVDRGGLHGIFTARPNIAPDIFEEGTYPMTALRKMDPLTELTPITDDIFAIWLATDKNAYNWIRIKEAGGPSKDVAPFVEYPDDYGVSGAPAIYVPTLYYYATGPTVQSIEYTITQYMEFMIGPGQIPPALATFADKVKAYERAVEDFKRADPKTRSLTLFPPPSPEFLSEMVHNIKTIRNTNLSNDLKWYDKIAYAFSGKRLKGAVKDLGSTLLKNLPEIAKGVAMLL